MTRYPTLPQREALAQVYTKLIDAWTDPAADFNARGDLLADDRLYLQDAIDATPKNGTVVFNRKFRVNATGGGALTLPRPMRFLGQGNGAGIYMRGGSGWLMDPASIDGLICEGMHFDGDYPTRTSGTFFALNSHSNLVFNRCIFENIPEHAIQFYNSNRVWVLNSRFKNIKACGVRLHDGGAGTANRDVWILGNDFLDCQGGRVAGNAAIQSAGSDTTGTNERVWVDRNRIKVPGLDGVGVGLDYVHHAHVNANEVEGKTPQTPDGNGEGIVVTGRSNEVTYNKSWNHGGSAGIMVFCKSGNMDGRDTLVGWNETWDNNNQGIAVVFNQNNITVSGMRILGNRSYDNGRGTQGYGFQAYNSTGVTGSAWAHSMMAFNDFAGNVTGGYDLIVSANLRRGFNFTGTNTMDDATQMIAT